MKPIGIVRRIDDLGRVVIPREIRRALRIKEGDPLEIFADSEKGQVIIQKYNNDLSSMEVSILSEHYGYFICPNCSTEIEYSGDYQDHKHCLNCGQKLDWGGTEYENMGND